MSTSLSPLMALRHFTAASTSSRLWVAAPARALSKSIRIHAQEKVSASPEGIPLSRTTSAEEGEDSKKKKSGIIKSILHGSEKAKAEQPTTDGDGSRSGQHSHIVGRGKYVHEVQSHRVKPDRVSEYKQIIEEFYTKLANDPRLDLKLTGSWEVTVGELDSFFHIWEHNGMAGLDAAIPHIANTETYRKLTEALQPLLYQRKTQLVQEFGFWPSSPPIELGGLYEMRTYDLKPGTLLEWENEWRIGLEARSKFVQPIGAWFSQVGELHKVIHMWHYDNLENRKNMRQKAWNIDSWTNTVAKTVKLSDRMSSQILRPLSFSPLR